MPPVRRISSVAAATAVGLVATLITAAPATAGAQLQSEASMGTAVGLNGFADLLVDEARQQVFVTGGAGNSSMVVMNYDGTVKTTITSLPAASGMVLQGSTLYVGRQGGNAIDLVDADTLQKTGSIALPEATGGALAMAGGKLWLQAGSCGSWGDLASVDPATEVFEAYASFTYYCPTFATHPGSPDILFVAERGLSPASIDELDVSGEPTVLADAWDPGGSSNLRELVVTPDGSSVLTASGFPYHVLELQASDLAATGMTYPTGPYPLAVDVSGAGAGLVAAGRWTPSTEDDIFVFPAGNTTPSWRYWIPDPNGGLYSAGLDITSDGARVFAVTGYLDSVVVFHSIAVGTPSPPPPSPPQPAAAGPSATKGKLKGFYEKDGKYRLYHAGDKPRYIIRVTPAPVEGAVEAVLQARYRGRWVETDVKVFPLLPDGSFGALVKRARKGFRYRASASFLGTDLLSASSSGWSYFQVTK